MGETLTLRSIVFVLPGITRLVPFLKAAFTHRFVATYQVGFGPPLFGATLELEKALSMARSALDRMEIYLVRCVLDVRERRRLNHLHGTLLVRNYGAVDEAALDDAAARMLDLSLRLHAPHRAPDVLQSELSAFESLNPSWFEDLDHAGARFVVRLSDVDGDRWLSRREVRALPRLGLDPIALELRVPGRLLGYYEMYSKDLAKGEGVLMVTGAPSTDER